MCFVGVSRSIDIPVMEAFEGLGLPDGVLYSSPIGADSSRRVRACNPSGWPTSNIRGDAFVKACLKARGFTEDAAEAALSGRYVKSESGGIARYNPDWARVGLISSEAKMHMRLRCANTT